MLHKVTDKKYISDTGDALVVVNGEWFLVHNNKIEPDFRFVTFDEAAEFFRLEDASQREQEIEYIEDVYSFERTRPDELSSRDKNVTILIVPDGYKIDDRDVMSMEQTLSYLDKHLGNAFETASTGYEGLADVTSGLSLRELTKKLVRVRSSNIWSRGINIKDIKDKFADVFIQFKGKNGGPGDIYQYFDVPINLWRKWLSAPSAGHFFWVNIRNKYLYRKLTGDRKGKLRNAVN